MLYLFYGEDQFSLRQEVEKIISTNLPPDAQDFNFAKIDAGRSGFNLDEVINTAEAYPFLSDKRVVVVNGLVARLGKGADNEGETPAPKATSKTVKGRASTATAPVTPRERFIKFLDNRPPTAIIILVENKAGKNDLIYKAVQKHGLVQEFIAPKGMQLEKWTQDRARFQKIKLEPRATTLLAQYIGSDLWRIENELQKLAAYAGEGQAVTGEMVEKLSAQVSDTPIYKLTESLSRKNLREALVQLNRMRDETTLNRAGFARYVFNGICRQVYDLLRVREMVASRHSPSDIASRLGMHPFVAEKTVDLSRNFQSARLDWLYNRLTELDYADKTGRADLTSELDLLLVEICAN